MAPGALPGARAGTAKGDRLAGWGTEGWGNERHEERSPGRVRFEELAADAVDELPEWVRQRLENVEVIVEDLPPPGQPGLLGLYEGVPLTKRHRYSGVLPDRITLFRRTIESQAAGDEDLKRSFATRSCTRSRTSSASRTTGSASLTATDLVVAGQMLVAASSSHP